MAEGADGSEENTIVTLLTPQPCLQRQSTRHTPEYNCAIFQSIAVLRELAVHKCHNEHFRKVANTVIETRAGSELNRYELLLNVGYHNNSVNGLVVRIVRATQRPVHRLH